jgi:F-type H+-transporting ATPase subunit b
MLDWVTVVAQLINFAILVALLKWLLYDRIIKAMDAREQRIADRLNEAEKRKKEAEKEAEDYRQKQQEIDQEKENILRQARDDAEQEKQRLRDQAREQVDQSKRQWLQGLRDQREDFVQNITRQGGREVCSIARRALDDLADAALEQQVIRVFRERLDDLDEETAAPVRDADQPLTVHTRWQLEQSLEDELTDALRGRFGDDREVRFETDEQVACGVELRSGGYVVGWNVDEYLRRLGERVGRLIDEQLQAAPDEADDRSADSEESDEQ